MVKKGDEVDAIVVEVDVDNQRISLGMKQLTQDPWKILIASINSVMSSKEKLQESPDTVPLLNSTMRSTAGSYYQISEERIEKVKDYLKEGEEVTARVIKIDKDERRIGLSIKAADYDEDALAKEVAAYDEVGEDLTTSLGDIFDEATAQEEG